MIHRRQSVSHSAGPLNRAVAAKANPKMNMMNSKGRMVEQAAFGQTGLPNTSMSNNVINIDLFPMLKGLVPDGYENYPLLNNLYRDIYYYDSVCGSAADLMSFMPFSDMTLGGVESGDKQKLDKFYESLDRINVRRLLPELSIDYLVLGTFIGSLVFNKERGIFTDVIPQDVDHCLRGDTKVLTDKGWHTMLEMAEPLPEGQSMPTEFPINYEINGKYYAGSAPYFKGRQHTYTVVLDNGQKLCGTSDHKILTYKRGEGWASDRFTDKKKWKQIKNLSAGDRVVLSDHEPVRVEKTLEYYEHYYLGVLMGDGTTHSEDSSPIANPSIRLFKKDKKEIFKTLEKAGVVGRVGYSYKGKETTKWNNRVHLNNRAKELMAKYHFVNKKSVDINNVTQLMGYISGLIVTDGWTTPSLHIAGAYDYLQPVFEMLLANGYPHCMLTLTAKKGDVSDFKHTGKQTVRTKDMYVLTIKRSSVRRIVDNLELTKDKTKKLTDSFKKRDRHLFKMPYASVVDVYPSGHNYVYDITVPGKERFNANGIIVHNCSMTPLPFYSQDPIIKVSIAKETIAALSGNSKRIQRIKKKLGKDVIDKMTSGSFELDPLTTLYVPRKTLSSREGISWFKRILPMYLLEKNLFKGTIIESAKRQRSIMHIQAGCLTGDSLVSVNGSLTRLDNIHSRKGMVAGTSVDVDFMTNGKDGQAVPVTKWWYQGQKQVAKVTTKSGYSIKGTLNHPVLVLTTGPDLVWKSIEDLKVGDYLCIDPNSTLSSNADELSLNIVQREYKKTPTLYDIPEVMTPELAYIIGLILSDGTLRENCVIIGNTDINILKRAQECFKHVFGIDGSIRLMHKSGKIEIFDRGYKGNRKDLYTFQANSTFITDILKQLGLKTNKQLNPSNEIKKVSKKKCIPWSILQADLESKYSFIAAYLDADGSVFSYSDSVELVICSYSKKMLKQFQIMLVDIGINSTITNGNKLFITRHDGTIHYENIKKYMSHQTKQYELGDDLYYDKTRGIPTSVIKPVIDEHYVGRSAERRQYVFKDDCGQDVALKYWGTVSDSIMRSGSNRLVYQNFGIDKYKDLMTNIGAISNDLALKIEKLVEVGYIFETIKTITKLKGKKHVYDLTIDSKHEPAFVANGIVVHNSTEWEPTIVDLQFLTELFMNADADPIGAMVATRSDVQVQDIRQGGDFWNITSVWADTVPAKLRALGISEGFLSSEANYSEAQNSLVVFTEWLAAFRYMIERNVFYDKLFPLISVVNGYYKTEEDKKKWRNSELDPEDILYELQDNSALMIPKIHWHKQLKPEGDTDYIGMLNTLSEAGVPVTLRALAAAGNLSLDQLMNEMEDDGRTRKQVQEMKAKWGAGAEGGMDGGAGGGDDGLGSDSDLSAEQASAILMGDRFTTLSTVSKDNPYVSGALSKLKAGKGQAHRPILSREYGEASVLKDVTKTGKPKVIHNQKLANDKINNIIAKAAAATNMTKKNKKSFFPTTRLR